MAKMDSMTISMIMGTASMTSALPIGASVRSSGTPRTASRSSRHDLASERSGFSSGWFTGLTVGVLESIMGRTPSDVGWRRAAGETAGAREPGYT
jgi:hypothetical protein